MKSLSRKIARFLVVLLLGAGASIAASIPVSIAAAEAPVQTDYDQQALSIAKFGRSYVEWPEITYSNEIRVVNICIFGSNPGFEKSLEGIRDKVASKVKINIKTDDSATDGCNIAYITRNNPNYKTIIANFAKKPVLTVSPIDGFAASNGMVEFVSNDTGNGGALSTKVQIEIKVNNKVATANGLKITPELLEAAKEVIN